jgi:hypothetical protein
VPHLARMLEDGRPTLAAERLCNGHRQTLKRFECLAKALAGIHFALSQCQWRFGQISSTWRLRT